MAPNTKATPLLDEALSDVEEGSAAAQQFPRGAVGRLAQYVMDTTRNPNPGLALGAALATVGKMSDRKVAGPTNSTTVLYIAMLGETGIGKQRPLTVPKQTLAATGYDILIGPGDWASVQSIQRLATQEPLNKLCCLDEFGIVFHRLVADAGNMNSVSITAALNTLWGIGWDRYDSVVRAHEDATYSVAPAVSFIGVSTYPQFYQALTAGMVGNGFINRLLIIEAAPKSASRTPPLPPDTIPDPLLKELGGLCPGLPNSVGLTDAVLKPLVRLGWGPGAEAAFAALEARMSMTDGLRQQEIDLRQRVAEQAIRVATIIAVGRGAAAWKGTRVVTLEDLEWGERIALASLRAIIEGLRKYAPALDYRELCEEIHEALRVVPGHWMSQRDMDREWGRRTKWNKSGVAEAVNQLRKEGTIIEDDRKPVNGGRISAGWRLATEAG